MTSFNATTYDKTSTAYNMMSPIFIDGSNSIPMSGPQYYNGMFGNVMAGFCVDGLDSILGGNVIMTGDVSCCSRLSVNGNVYIGGNTTFSTIPVCSSVPTTNFQLTNKNYVDSVISTGGGTQLLNSNNTWNGVNTFNSLPVCSSVPTTIYQLTNKSYVDNALLNLNGLNLSTEIIGFNNITCTSISTNVIRT